MKKKAFFTFLALGCLLSYNVAFAAEWEQDASGWRYKQDNGTYARDTQLWIDDDNDTIFKKYDFDANGYCIINTVGHGNEQYNENGEWIYNGEVQTLKKSSKEYSNWLDILVQADALMGKSFEEVQTLYGAPTSKYASDILWYTETYTFENSPLQYRFAKSRNQLICDYISVDNNFVPDGHTMRELKNALNVNVYCSYFSTYTYGKLVGEGYSYNFNCGANSWGITLQEQKDSLDVPLKIASLSIFPFNSDYQGNAGTERISEDVQFGYKNWIKLLQ